ncbi:PF20097 family protein [Nitrosopumilus sp.]|nr:PF20097 family protein [Nitrosopumilus sp.]MCV0431066.1 PF20097 family protein [Nitrosopumilus sp.]
MDCPKCKIEMEKGHITAKSKGKLMYSTNWYCEKCGHREFSQHNVEF